MRIASIQPVVHPGQIEAPPGLEGVIVAETQVGDVRGQEGFYHYRQYSAVELADKRSLEDVWYLLFEGHLPERGRATRPSRRDPRPRRRTRRRSVDAAPGHRQRPAAPLMDELRSAVSLIGHSEGFQPVARHPGRGAAGQRPAGLRGGADAHHGAPPAGPRARSRSTPTPTCGYGANYLWMLTGEEPDPDVARAVEQYQIAHDRPRVQRLDVHRPGHHLDRRRPGRPPSPAASAPCRARSTAARPAGRSTCSTPSAPRTTPGRTWSTPSPRASRSWASATGSTRPTTPARCSSGAWPSASAPRRSTSPSRSSRRSSTCSPSSSPGRNLYANVEFYAGVVMDHCGLPPELFSPDVRVEPGHRLVRQHPRAGGRQPDHPAVGPLRRPAAAPARARRRTDRR